MTKKDTSADGTPDTEKPLPDPLPARRPGTSGTEFGLRTERRKASTAYQRAQRAEKIYRAKKQASTARTNISAAKVHFKAAFKSGKIGCVFFWSGVRALPGLVGEKKAGWREGREEKRRDKQAEKRKKLEERMEREGSEGEA